MQVRFATDDVVIHLASAGSGKTTAAMNEIASALREYRPDEIAFVTYTKKGVENGIERALKVNPDLTPDDLMHFKTLHALCFREAHLTRKNMMSSDDIARFNEAFGFSLSLSDAFGYVSEDDRLLQRYDARRSGSRRGVFVDGNFDRFRYDRLVNAYEAFKEAHGLVDFFDCLTLYMERGEPLKGVKLAVIDECFSPDTLVRMADGSVRAIKDIRVGDYVMGTSGAACVLEKHVGVDQMYEVSRADADSTAGADPMLFRCNSMHLIEDSMHRWNACSAYFWERGHYGKPMVYMADDEQYCLVEIRRIDEGCYVGIGVDSPDHLFLLANGCVVHNCQDLTALQWQVCMKAFAGAERIRCFGDDFQCQPEGTIVHTENGGMPIELCGGKRLLTYDMSEGLYKMSDPVKLAVRETDEPLYEVRMRLPGNTFYNYGSGVSWFTGNHKLIVRDKNRWNIRTRTIKECLGKTSGLLVPWFNIEHGVLSSILPDWVPFDVSISRVSPGAPYKVYSLDVPEFHTYVADGGLTVHNCLYTYNGAAPELLVEMASHYETVKHETSYRLPRKVYEFARGITDVIQEKVEKDYRPATDREGFVRELGDRNVLARVIRDDLRANGPKPGRWYLLFRTNCFIADMAKTLEQFIVPYHTVKGFCIPKRELARIERYYNFRKEGFGSAESRARFAEEYKIKDFNESFTESELVPGRERYFFQDLVDAYGIKALKAMCDMDEPWLLLSTVHRVKGGEADYTAMFMDCTRVVSENMTLSADDELRVLYVGCTRCREGLYLIPALGKYSMSRLLDIVREVNDVKDLRV